MRISFDLDGVITNSEKWFFGMLSTMRTVHANQDLLDAIEILYYSTRSVRHNPYTLMASGDEGFIITARKPISRAVTDEWLETHGILLPVVYIDQHDTIDWSDYKEASSVSGKRKADIIQSKGILTHFDNNPFIVSEIRELLPSVSVILVGGEPCLSSM